MFWKYLLAGFCSPGILRQGSSSGFRWVTSLISVTRLLMRVRFCIFAMGTPGRHYKEQDLKARGLSFFFSLSLQASCPCLLGHSHLNSWIYDFRNGWVGRKIEVRKKTTQRPQWLPSSWKEFRVFVGIWKYMQRKCTAPTYFFFSLICGYRKVNVLGLHGNRAAFSCHCRSGAQFCQQILKKYTRLPPIPVSWDAVPKTLFPNPTRPVRFTFKPFWRLLYTRWPPLLHLKVSLLICVCKNINFSNYKYIFTY